MLDDAEIRRIDEELMRRFLGSTCAVSIHGVLETLTRRVASGGHGILDAGRRQDTRAAPCSREGTSRPQPEVCEGVPPPRPTRSWYRGLLLTLEVAVLTSCGGQADTGGPPLTPAAAPVTLAPLPARSRERCLRVDVLAPRCPNDLPATSFAYRVRELDYGTDAYRVVEFAANAPYPRIGRRNAPPRFAHVVLKGGDLSDAFYFEWPSSPAVPVHDALVGDRQVPVILEAPSIGGRRGTLVLAPAFPAGGVDADHLIFRWRQDGHEYALSLHAWQPVDRCVATLHALVASVV